MRTVIVKSLVLALFIGLVTVQPALAYIDPNVGGQLFQILATGFAVFSGMALLFSRQIRSGVAKLRRFLRERDGSDEDEDEKQVGFP
jgi:hypothetical protein